MLKIPELLAPAGGFEQLRAAVENGADAVYMGGKLFNARMNAKNFEEEELYQALAYAHVRGVKLYITMNTLLFEEELEEAVSYAKELYEMGVDALILQDFGLAKLIRTYLPNMEIHLSTQGTVYNASGVSAAKEMGFQRVVLARETSLEEITEMTRENVAEIEIFVHGALCICYSGQCQMSREIGGRSGNRGSCGQPCRLPYSIYEEIKGKKVKVKDETFLLSPKDLCTIENLGAFAEAGVSSLKIEGRMKSPEYVATVTRIYRNYLDIYREKGSYTVSPQDFKDLNQIFNRGGFTDGYLFGNHGEAMMSGALSKHQGIYLGKVLKNSTGNNYIQVELEEPLSLGDGIEVRTPGLPGNVVTFLKIVEEGKGNAIKAGGKSIRTAFPGQTVIMGDVCGSFKKGDRVYKITDRGLLESAKASYEAKSWKDQKELKKSPISLFFRGSKADGLTLEIRDRENSMIVKQNKEAIAWATGKGTTKERIEEQLRKVGGTPFEVLHCHVVVEDQLFIPLSKINELRREALEELEALFAKPRAKNFSEQLVYKPFCHEKEETDPIRNPTRAGAVLKTLYLFRKEDLYKMDGSYDKIYVPHQWLTEENEERKMVEELAEKGTVFVPIISNVTKGKEDAYIRKHFDKIVRVGEKNGIMVGNLGWILPLVETGIPIYGDYGLNLCNSQDFLVAKEWGLKGAMVSHEVNFEAMEAINFHGLEIEVAAYGRIPVMVSEHIVAEAILKTKNGNPLFLKDRKEEYYPFIQNEENGKCVIFSYKINNIQNEQEFLRRNPINALRKYGI